MTELFIVGANGQFEVNFDSLVLVTSEIFVRKIKEELKDSDSKIVEIRTLKKSGNIIVRICWRDLFLFEYVYSSEGFILERRISLSDVEMFLKLTGREGLK
jgi:hypothetical protein